MRFKKLLDPSSRFDVTINMKEPRNGRKVPNAVAISIASGLRT
jgi:hypothetical protein